MLQRSVTYTDFNGQKQTDELLFNLTTLEVVELEAELEGGFKEYVERITNDETKDNKAIIDLFKRVLLMSYGVKSEDGRYFVKDVPEVKNFKYSAAFDALYRELLTDEQAMAYFVNGVIDVNVNAKEASKEQLKKLRSTRNRLDDVVANAS